MASTGSLTSISTGDTSQNSRTMAAIPNFAEVAQSENKEAAESETQKGETVQTLELTEGEIDNYTAYEAMVDVGRYASALLKETGDDRYQSVVDWAVEKKEELRKECKEQDGNLPMFRAAFPVEDRANDVWVLPAEEAAEVGIDYDSEDYIALPVYDGTKWNPKLIDDEPVEDSNDESETETVEDGEPQTEAQKRVVKVLDENPDDDAETVANAANSSEGWVRHFAKKFRPNHPAAVGDSSNDGDDEQDDEAETETAALPDETEAAKVEALKALTETLNKTAEAIESL